MSKLSERLNEFYGDVKKRVKDADTLRRGCSSGRNPKEQADALKDSGQIPNEGSERN